MLAGMKPQAVLALGFVLAVAALASGGGGGKEPVQEAGDESHWKIGLRDISSFRRQQ